MSKRRDTRRLAMQVLYQIDVTGQDQPETILELLDDEYDPADVRAEAVGIAVAAWQHHPEADRIVTELAPDWPTHRQPPVDRAILRLAYYEIIAEVTPVKVAINEAVELSKKYAAENSPAFINGVLDKIAKRLRNTEKNQTCEVIDHNEPKPGEQALAEHINPETRKEPDNNDGSVQRDTE